MLWTGQRADHPTQQFLNRQAASFDTAVEADRQDRAVRERLQQNQRPIQMDSHRQHSLGETPVTLLTECLDIA